MQNMTNYAAREKWYKILKHTLKRMMYDPRFNALTDVTNVLIFEEKEDGVHVSCIGCRGGIEFEYGSREVQ